MSAGRRDVEAVPVDRVPEGAIDAARSPDGRWRLETSPVRTHKLDLATGEATVVLEGWHQLAPAWLSDDRLCVLCREGEVELDLADAEIGSLRTLREAYPGEQGVVRAQSSGLLHVLSAGGDYLHHVAVDADHLDADPRRGLVVLTRTRTWKRRDEPRWRTAILAATPAGLAVVAKLPVDIGRLRVSVGPPGAAASLGGDRLFGSNGFELVGVDAALAAAGSWRTVAIADELELEQPPPPPPSTLTLAPTTDLALERERTSARPPERPGLDELGLDEVWRSWPPVISAWRGADAIWAIIRVHQALCELIRFEPRDGGWAATANLPVEGFDRVRVGAGGRLAVVTIDNAPPEMAWSMFLALDEGGAVRNLGRLHHVVTAVWDDGDRVLVELLGGEVYRVDGLAAAIAAARAAEPRPLRALVFDVPGHYGRREFLPRYDHDIGFIDREGNLAIDYQFTSALDFDGGVARAAHCGPRLFGLVDRDGRLVVPHHYSWIGELRGGCRRIGRGEPDICGDPPAHARWGLLRDDGEVLLAPEAITVHDMVDGRAAVERRPGKWNLLARDGRWLLAEDVDEDELPPAETVEEALQQDEVIASGFEHVGPLIDGRAVVCQRGRWGFIDAAAQLVIQPRFSAALPFSEGLAAVRSAGRWGFVDAAGAIVIPPRFGTCGSFHDGRARVTRSRP